MMDEGVRELLWDINYALNGKPTSQPVGPTSYKTYGVGDGTPDRFSVYRNGAWFVVTARRCTEAEQP